RQVAVPGVVADDGCDESCPLRDERTRRAVDAVAERPRRFPYALARLPADVALVVQRAGGGRDRDAGALCNGADRRTIAHRPNDMDRRGPLDSRGVLSDDDP